MTIAPGFESRDRLQEINRNYMDTMDSQTKLIDELQEQLTAKDAEIKRLEGLCQDYHAEADSRDAEIEELTCRLAKEKKAATHALKLLENALKDAEHLQGRLDESPHSFRCPEGLRYGRGDIPAVCTCHKSKSRGERDTEIELLKKGSKVAHEAREICEAAYDRAEKAHEKREAVYRAFVEAHDNVLETEDRWLYGKATYAEVCKSRDDRKEARAALEIYENQEVL